MRLQRVICIRVPHSSQTLLANIGRGFYGELINLNLIVHYYDTKYDVCESKYENGSGNSAAISLSHIYLQSVIMKSDKDSKIKTLSNLTYSRQKLIVETIKSRYSAYALLV